MDIIRVSHKKVYDRDKFIKKVKRLQKDNKTTQAYIGQSIGRDASTMSRMISKEFYFSLNDGKRYIKQRIAFSDFFHLLEKSDMADTYQYCIDTMIDESGQDMELESAQELYEENESQQETQLTVINSERKIEEAV